MLFCTGYRWDNTKTPRDASVFLDEVHDVCVTGGWRGRLLDREAAPTARATRLLASGPTTSPWPFDPLADRRPAVEDAAALVESMAAHVEGGPVDPRR